MVEFSSRTQSAIRCAVDILRASTRTTVLTGAGISTPSGIPDFRSSTDGLWSRYDPFEVASLTAFRYNPEKFYDWMRPLAIQMFNAEPNEAHLGLARLEDAGFVETIITQNIDSLHHRAGSVNILEVHGSMEAMTCMNCFHKSPSSDYLDAYLNFGDIPLCSECSGVMKPDIILMEEQLPVRTWLKAVDSSETCSAMIVAGSSLEVVPVARLPMQAVNHGAHLIIINNSSTYIDPRADVVIHKDLVDIIPAITRQLLD